MKKNRLMEKDLWNGSIIDELIEDNNVSPVDTLIVGELCRYDREIANDKQFALFLDETTTHYTNQCMNIAFKYGVDLTLELLGMNTAFGVLPKEIKE